MTIYAQMKKKETKKQTAPHEKHAPAQKSGPEFTFGRENYKLLLIGLAFIAVGFLLMIGGGSDDPNEFSSKIFNFRRLTLAPILVVAGYIIEIFAIMKKPSK